MNTRMRILGSVLVLALACGEEKREDDPTLTGIADAGAIDTGAAGDGDDDDDDDGDDDDDDGLKLDVGNDGMDEGGDEAGGDCDPPTSNATLRGTVYAPNLEVPISGALVYVTQEPAEPVPDEVYCAECVTIPCDAHFQLTEADGSFELPAIAGNYNLIVTKGQFLRESQIEIVEGDNDIAAADSSLPGRWSPDDGEWIPRIAVAQTETDAIYNILAKLGMGDVNGGALVNGSESFDLLDQASAGALLDDLDAMREYHIIFVPCLANQGMGALTQSRIDNIRQYVAEGGKWYVTDWSNEYLYDVFPSYQTMHQDPLFGGPDLGLYDTTGAVLDPGLREWLEALPAPLKDIGGGHPNLLSLPQVQLVDNWSGIDDIPPILVEDADGNEVNVGHYPWVEGPCLACNPSNTFRPMTISGQYGCGRMMFSTYHTDESVHEGLTPQELILLYIILEIGVCFDETPPPPPPEG